MSIMPQTVLTAKADVNGIPLDKVLDELEMNEAEFEAMVREGERDFRAGKTLSEEQAKRELGLA